MGSKKKTETKSNQTQTVAPPSWTMPGISNAADKVTAALNNLPGKKYEGPFVAQPNQGLTDSAIGAYTGAAQTGLQLGGQVQSAIDGLAKLPGVATGQYDMGATANLNPVIEAATAPLMRQLTEGTLPGLRNSALEAGAYSGDRAMSVLPGMAVRDAAESAQRIGAEIGYQDYNDREARRLQAYGIDQANSLDAQKFNNTFQQNNAAMMPDLVDTIMRMQSSGGDLYSAALGLDTQRQQAAIDNNMAANDYEWQYPFQGLDIATNLLSRLSGGYGTTTSNGTQTSVQTSSGLGNVVSGLAGLAGMVGSLPMGGGMSLGGKMLGSLFSRKAA